MAVAYRQDVTTSSSNFCKLLFIWRGSVYKLIWLDLLAYCTLYATFSVIYRFALNEEQRITFELVSLHCEHFTNFIPISFVLGFYVSVIVSRRWKQFNSIPWPDTLSFHVTAALQGSDEVSCDMRHTIMRYVNLTITFTFAMMSPVAKERFSKLQDYLDEGLMTKNEKNIFENFHDGIKQYYWMPLVWAISLLSMAKRQGLIQDDYPVRTIIYKISDLRGTCGVLLGYDWINVPLVYTQVVTIAVYVFFVSSLMGRQFLDQSKGYPNHEIDYYVPIFTILQFVFYIGLLKVAESLLNPFGGDDDDFDIDYLINRNKRVVGFVADKVHYEHPELLQDKCWDKTSPDDEKPNTYKGDVLKGSTPKQAIIKEKECIPLVDINNENEPLVKEYE